MTFGTDDGAAARRLDHLIWAAILAVTVVVLAAPAASNFYIAWAAFAVPVPVSLALVAGGWFYRNWRGDLRLASGLDSTAQVVAFAAVGAPLSYLAASANLPLQDHLFDSIDRALGLDWKALLAVMNEAPALRAVLRVIYLSLTLQMTTAVLCLAFSGRLVWLRVYTLAFIFTALVTIAISAVLPAAGVWPYYGLTPADSPHIIPAVSSSWPVFYGLRDGSFRALVAVGSEGIITFPSLHAALAVILIAALWPIPRLRWVILGVNVVMLAATPIDGSHYFIDVIAGVVVAAAALAAANALAKWAGAKHPLPDSAPAGPGLAPPSGLAGQARQ
jgi:membrane-associated phospholipid phosphatase